MFKLILISLPSPDAELFASAFKNLPFSLLPGLYLVLESAPLTFLTFKVYSSSSVNSNTTIFSAYEEFENTSIPVEYVDPHDIGYIPTNNFIIPSDFNLSRR